MPIRGIDVFVRELKLAQETRIGALADTRLGIEGHNWLRQMLLNTRDGDAVAMGGVPGALEAEIVKEVEFLRRSGITPIVVFSGLPVARKDGRWFSKDDTRAASRSSAWEQHWQRHTEQAQRGWASAPAQAQGDMVPYVMQVLQAHGVEAMRAPYSSWGQLAYLYKHETQAVHAVYASLDMVMFDVDRVVTSVSSAKSTFTWVQREHLLSKCGVTAEQAVDMCLLAGFDWCPTFPALVGDGGFSFRFAVDTVRQFRSGLNAIQMLGDQAGGGGGTTSYSDTFLRAQCIVRYHIVLMADGSVGPLNADYAPNDLHDIIGYRLPTAAYVLMAQGVIQPGVLQMAVSGVWLEFPPGDNGDAAEYRRLVTQWERDVLRRQCAALSSSLGAFYAQRKVAMHAWFEPHAETVLQSGGGGKGSSTGGRDGDEISAEALGVLGGDVSLCSVLEHSEALAAGRRPAGSGGPRSGDDTYAAVLLATAVSLGLVGRDGRRTLVGQAAVAAMRELRKGGAGRAGAEAQQWAAAAAAILLEQGALSGDKWSVSYEDALGQGPASASGAELGQQEQAHVRWLSRIAALVAMEPARRGRWELGLSRDVLAFSSAARLVAKAAASSADAACVVLARPAGVGDASRLRALRAHAPLEGTVSAAGGLVALAVLGAHGHGHGHGHGRADVAGVAGARQALDDAWALSGAVVAAAEALGLAAAAAGLRSARAWGEAALRGGAGGDSVF
ncbi:hypothetical protein GGI04_002663 [Coemansia thaxteri]|uniref:XPG-I domain-containing protein n=1 Tax=Coemansia thaxteri TaxID=2663907 RepID=A0A9W8BI48_9FUNG|nr:hypothetical protein H4R26_003372 [Coemansia thaxteri]KAJ2004264.1 hypothetical protein GGI04_002663 [Coemansia thaxteri]KAJ2471472.1 hypothetical protein GGI02_002251 [Coemansia sp. RSA 2322]